MPAAWEIIRRSWKTWHNGKTYLVAIKEMWNELHSWSTVIKACKLFRRNTGGWRGRGVALCVKKWIDCRELPSRNSHGQVESLRAATGTGPLKDVW